ncbi:MAG: SDR family oxidoreductase [Candidatus Hermodarchaeota archaeon]
MKDKVCIVTGANSGIGKATALGLAKLGATIIMVSRNKERGEVAQTEIINKSENTLVDLFIADLSLQQSIQKFASEFKKKYNKLHVLINNAGINPTKRRLTPEGIEETFAVNVLAPFLLTNLLLDILKASKPARIINVASAVHSKKINFNNLQGEKRFIHWKVYAQSKVALILITYEFARRLMNSGITVNCLHPGGVKTNIMRDYKGFVKFFGKLFFSFAKSPQEGAETSIYLASSPDVENISGKYFIDKEEAKSKDITYDELIAKKLWDASVKLTNVDLDIN